MNKLSTESTADAAAEPLVEPTVSPTGMRILSLLMGQPGKTLIQLMEETKVTRTAIMEQLATLMSAGVVAREAHRAGRGRPHHVYSATPAAHRLFQGAEAVFVPAMLEAVASRFGQDALRQLLNDAAGNMAAHYLPRIRAVDPNDRLREFAALLQTEGVLVDLTENDGRCTMHERSCPFYNAFGDNRAACEVERAMMSRIVDAPIELLDCRLDGCSGCTFQLGPSLSPPSANL